MMMTKTVSLKTCDFPILDWVDRELADTYHLSYHPTSKGDILLELRYHFSATQNQASPNKLIGGFYQLLPRLEEHYYLLGYRIRQWIALNFSIKLSDPLNRASNLTKPICQTLRTLEPERKAYFEECTYSIPYHDIRAQIVAKEVSS